MTQGENKNYGSPATTGDMFKSGKTEPAYKEDMLKIPSILTGLSHEVRTHMNSIVAFSFLSNNEGCTADERTEYNEHIMKSCNQLITLFDNFLDSVLIDSDIPNSTYTGCNLNELILDIENELRQSVEKYNSKVTLTMENNSDDEIVFIDKEKITRVFRNLFFNALETIDSGYIKIGYKKENGRFIFYVTDSGNGYSRNRELIECRDLSGYIGKHQNTFTTVSFIFSQKLIESMNGKFWIEPNGVNGTSVCFSVPEHKQIRDSKSESITSRIAI